MPDLPSASPVRPEPVDAVPRVPADRVLRDQAQQPRAARAEQGVRVEISLAAREAFLESISTPKKSASAIADRIFSGIISYLYDAFQLEKPNPTREQLEGFVGAATRGMDRGLRDAASLLVAFGVRYEAVAAERAEIFESVRAAVVDFADTQTRTGRADPSDPAARDVPDMFGSGADSE